MAETERTGLLFETGDPAIQERVALDEIRTRLIEEDDLVVLEDATWNGPKGAERMARLCREEGLSRVVVCGPSAESSLLPEWLDPDESGRGIPVTCAALGEGPTSPGLDREAATAKAERLVRMALARASALEPISLVEVSVERRVAVVGSNHAAYAVASALADAGYPVLLLETEFPSGCYFSMAAALVETVRNRPDVETVPGASLYQLDGGVGAFRLKVETPEGKKTFSVGAIVVAVDARTEPLDLDDGLASNGKVLTLRDYGQELAAGGLDGESVCIWLDRGDRDRRCAGTAAVQFSLDHARKGGKPTVLAHQMPVYGLGGQQVYDEARAAGVTFIRYNGVPPRVSPNGGDLTLTVTDTVLPDRVLELSVDRLVLPEPVVPSAGNVALSRLLGQPLDKLGYLQSGNVRHRPVGSARRGIFFVGGCHDECDPADARLEAQAVLAELMAQLPEGTVRVPAQKVAMNKSKCVGCLTCLRTCPHGAVHPEESRFHHRMEILDPSCWECGICASVCPGKAIEHGSLRGSQVHSILEVAGRDLLGEPPIVAFACRQSAVRAADEAARLGLDLPLHVLLIDVPCAGLVQETMILDAVEQGARGVLVLGCHHDNCRSLRGTDLTHKRVEKLQGDLGGRAGQGERLRYHSLAANESHRLCDLLNRAVEEMPRGRIGSPQV